MILTSLSPTVLPLHATKDAVLRLVNTDTLPCANLVLEFRVSTTMALERGRRQIELARLEPGRPYDHLLQLRAVAPGNGMLSLTNFSYRDGLGIPQRIRGRTLEIEIGPPEPERKPPSTTRPEPGAGTGGESAGLFISYRRSDGRWIASRLAEHLRRRYLHRQVFLDSRSIGLGEDFRRRLAAELDSCVALLAVIGPRWLQGSTPPTRQIDDVDDFVRYEISVALQRNILVIPVLFDTSMPTAEQLPAEIAPLADRQAHVLDPDRFDSDVGDLVIALDKVMRSRR